jgi:AcrR family transcriptional regulator
MRASALNMEEMDTRSSDDSRPKRQRNPRGQGARLREEIIAAAQGILEKTGSEEAVTLRAVAREVGIAAPSIAPHFAHPADIIDAAIAAELAVLHDAIRDAYNSTVDPVERVLLTCRAYYDFGLTRSGSYRVLTARRYLSDWQEDGSDMPQTFPVMVAAFGFVVTAIQACIDAGLSTSKDAYFDCIVLWCAVHGLIVLPNAITSLPWPDQDQLFRASIIRATGLKVDEG